MRIRRIRRIRQIFWKLRHETNPRNESFENGWIRDPRYDTNPGFVITKQNEPFWSQDSWSRNETNPWIRETNPRFYESLIRFPHPFQIIIPYLNFDKFLFDHFTSIIFWKNDIQKNCLLNKIFFFFEKNNSYCIFIKFTKLILIQKRYFSSYNNSIYRMIIAGRPIYSTSKTSTFSPKTSTV